MNRQSIDLIGAATFAALIHESLVTASAYETCEKHVIAALRIEDARIRFLKLACALGYEVKKIEPKTAKEAA